MRITCSCINCQTRKRWNFTYYASFLKDHPEAKSFINRQKRIDKKALPCFNLVDPEIRDWTDNISMEDMQTLYAEEGY